MSVVDQIMLSALDKAYITCDNLCVNYLQSSIS